MTTSIDIAVPTSDIGNPLPNMRQEKFCLALVGGLSQSEAYRRAGYSNRTCRHTASTLLTNVNIKRRVAELQAAAVDASIMGVIERKARLSEIGRGRILDYHNKHGVLDPFGDSVPNPGALSEVQQEYDIHGLEAYPTKIKLHDPVKAISELNRMEGAYPPTQMEVTGRGGRPIEVKDTRERLLGILARLSIRIEETGDHPKS